MRPSKYATPGLQYNFSKEATSGFVIINLNRGLKVVVLFAPNLFSIEAIRTLSNRFQPRPILGSGFMSHTNMFQPRGHLVHTCEYVMLGISCMDKSVICLIKNLVLMNHCIVVVP